MQNHHEPSAFYLTSNWLAPLPEILTRSKHQSHAAQHTFLGSTRFTRMTSSSSWDTESASQMRGVIMSNMKVLTFPECLSLEQTGHLPSLYQVNYLRCFQCVTISQMTVCVGAFSSTQVHRHACFLSVSHFLVTSEPIFYHNCFQKLYIYIFFFKHVLLLSILDHTGGGGGGGGGGGDKWRKKTKSWLQDQWLDAVFDFNRLCPRPPVLFPYCVTTDCPLAAGKQTLHASIPAYANRSRMLVRLVASFLLFTTSSKVLC